MADSDGVTVSNYFCIVTPRSFSSTTMGDISEMDYEKVKSGLEDKSIVLIDVRTAEERKEKHGAIPGSKHVWSEFRIFWSARNCEVLYMLVCYSDTERS